MGNEVSNFVDRHFGHDSDLANAFHQPKLALEPARRNAAVSSDDRLYEGTKEAIVNRPTIAYPPASWSKEQTIEWWNPNSNNNNNNTENNAAEVLAQWSGSLPKEMEDGLFVQDRLVQGVNVRILKQKKLLLAPAVVYMQGGGFGGSSSFNDAVYKNYLGRLAALGQCIVIAVDPVSVQSKSFAAAVNDCALVAQEAANGNITRVRAGPVLLAGNSTGGTLALATAIKAKKEGWVEKISGIYTICPMAEAVASSPKFPSMAEFNGYSISEAYLQAAVVNMVQDELKTNKKLFPMSATKDELKGLPPTKIIVYQLDMLRDMGIAMHFKLMKAGVSASFNITSGGVHDQQLFTVHSPEVTQASIHDLSQFINYAGTLAGLDFKPKDTAAVTTTTTPSSSTSNNKESPKRSGSVARSGSVGRGVMAASSGANNSSSSTSKLQQTDRRNSLGSQQSKGKSRASMTTATLVAEKSKKSVNDKKSVSSVDSRSITKNASVKNRSANSTKSN
ncbi:hypothetical protein ACA910_013374 [Epithemia clementina (nom. ined.)]